MKCGLFLLKGLFVLAQVPVGVPKASRRLFSGSGFRRLREITVSSIPLEEVSWYRVAVT